MSKFIRLTEDDGDDSKPLIINTLHVVFFQERKIYNGYDQESRPVTFLKMVDGTKLYVKETVDQVLKSIYISDK